MSRFKSVYNPKQNKFINKDVLERELVFKHYIIHVHTTKECKVSILSVSLPLATSGSHLPLDKEPVTNTTDKWWHLMKDIRWKELSSWTMGAPINY